MFDEVTEKIFAFYPREMFSLWFLTTTNKNSITIKLTDVDLFDERTARKFIWKCRLDYFSRMLSWYESRVSYMDDYPNPESAKIHVTNEIKMIVFNFVKALEIIEDSQFSSDFRQKVENCSRNFAKCNVEKPIEPLDLRAVFMLCLLGTTNHIAGVGLPTNLMEHGTDLVGHFFRAFHHEEWLRAGRLVGDVNWLSDKSNSKRSKKF